MNFTARSVKPDLKPQNEDFVFEVETPRGHFFAVLDFSPHDYANLNTTLEAKLETIVESFVTLSRFSAELFLGFLAKEINNFLYNLAQQAGGPELLCSAVLSLVSGNRLSYFSRGDVGMALLTQDEVLHLTGHEEKESCSETETAPQSSRLGEYHQETPLTDQVQLFNLKEGEVVLIMSRGLASQFDDATLREQVFRIQPLDPRQV